MKTNFLFSFVLLITCPTFVLGGFHWRTEDGGNGHFYELTWTQQPSIVSWSDAKLAAENSYLQGVQGHLATVTSSEENDFLKLNFVSEWQAPGNSAWIGLTDRTSEGDFRWITGETSTYSNWAPGSPNDLNGEDYVGYWMPIGLSGQREFLWEDFRDAWNTGDTDQRVGYFTEYDLASVPEPASMVIWGIGALGMGFVARRRSRKAVIV